jgi:hypothetical protein
MPHGTLLIQVFSFKHVTWIENRKIRKNNLGTRTSLYSLCTDGRDSLVPCGMEALPQIFHSLQFNKYVY